MKFKTMHSFGALAGILFAQSLAMAAASDLVPISDAIVVGYISSRTESSTDVSFDLSIDRVLAGTISSPTVHVDHPWARKVFTPGQNGPRVLVERFYGVWCLMRSGSSTWDVLVARGLAGIMPGLYWPASPTLLPQYQYSPADDPVDKIAYEVASGLTAAGTYPEGFLDCAGSLNTPAVQNVLTNFLSSSNPRFRAIGLAGLLARSQQGSIAAFVAMWPTISSDASRSFSISALRDSFRATDAASVQQLAVFADTPSIDADVRQASVRALASIHTIEALPFLASLLSSSDPDERMRGVFGLSSFANGCPPQTPDNVVSMDYLQFKNPAPYKTKDTIAQFAFRRGPADQESQLITFWLGWWNANKASILSN